MSKSLPIVWLMLLLAFAASAQQDQTPPKAAPVAPYVIPPDAVRQANPVKATPESLTEGQQIRNALRYGISLARAFDGDVLLLHVLKLHNDENGERKDPVGEVKTRLNEFLNEHPAASAMVSSRVEFGNAARLIVNVAEQSRADVIVMGVRAWSTDGPPMWQTAYDVLIQARCPVLSMKTPALAASERDQGRYSTLCTDEHWRVSELTLRSSASRHNAWVRFPQC